MSESTNRVERRRKVTKEPGYVYSDGALKSSAPNSVNWNRKVIIGVLISILILIVLSVVGFFFFTYSTVEEVPPNLDSPLPCPIPNKTIGYSILAEDALISPDYTYYFYAGQLSFSRAQQVCRNLTGGGDLLTITSGSQESAINERVSKMSAKIFSDNKNISTGLLRMLWTGGYFDLELDKWDRMRWIDASSYSQSVSQWYQNFCDRKQAVRLLTGLYEDYRTNGHVIDPLVYVVKDYRGLRNNLGEHGCWQLFSSAQVEAERIEFNFICQVATLSLPFRFKRRFLGKLRPNAQSKYFANEYVAFAGQGDYYLAKETCQRLAPGSSMLATNTLLRDSEVNKRVQYHATEIFGDDDGDPRRRTLIWTGGYFNLSSAYPNKVRWMNDPNAILDINDEPLQYWGSSNTKPSIYENFCGTIEYYQEIIDKALTQERDSTKTTGCIKGRLFLIAKDYRDGQAVQGCWHVYDLDFLSRHDYKLFLVCQLPDPVERNKFNFEESENVFSYRYNSKDP